jgi:mannan endo-1,6-alpha-mannosidase
MGGKSFAVALLAVVAFGRVIADGLPISSRDDILKSVSALAEELISYYEGDELGNVPGLLPEDKYFFWESGLFMTSFIDYWRITGDDTYNEPVREGILWQTGDKKDFMPANQSELLTNDDQCTWALAAMTAAEYEFPNPPEDQPQWAALAQAVFDSQRRRLNAEDGEDGTCGGGLRWTISLASPGYDYKNGTPLATLTTLFLSLRSK